MQVRIHRFRFDDYVTDDVIQTIDNVLHVQTTTLNQLIICVKDEKDPIEIELQENIYFGVSP